MDPTHGKISLHKDCKLPLAALGIAPLSGLICNTLSGLMHTLSFPELSVLPAAASGTAYLQNKWLPDAAQLHACTICCGLNSEQEGVQVKHAAFKREQQNPASSSIWPIIMPVSTEGAVQQPRVA